MRDLKEFIGESIVLEAKVSDGVEITLPNYEAWDSKLSEAEPWKTFKFPVAKYVVYKDAYHGDALHFATIDDMVRNISMFSDDFEDFDPKKDIVYASDNFKETIDWYMKKLGIDLKKVKVESDDELEDAIYDMYGDQLDKACDSPWFFANYGKGTAEQEKEYCEGVEKWLDMNFMKEKPQEWFNSMGEEWGVGN